MHTMFHSQTLPRTLATEVRQRLTAAHADQPFSPLDTRQATRRVASIAQELGLAVTIYRGGLDLRGAEVDHLWVAATRLGQAGDRPFVLDVAFPLFDPDFVRALRSFVAGDASREQLAAAGQGGVDRRVVGEIPNPLRYVGAPVWSAR